jgi:hypothetical protein
MCAARQDLAIDHEQRYSFAAATRPLLCQDGGTCGQESLGYVDSLSFVDDLDGDEAIRRLPRPRGGGLKHEGELELGEYAGKLVEGIDPHRLRLVDPKLARNLQRAVLVIRDLKGGIRR